MALKVLFRPLDLTWFSILLERSGLLGQRSLILYVVRWGLNVYFYHLGEIKHLSQFTIRVILFATLSASFIIGVEMTFLWENFCCGAKSKRKDLIQKKKEESLKCEVIIIIFSICIMAQINKISCIIILS